LAIQPNGLVVNANLLEFDPDLLVALQRPPNQVDGLWQQQFPHLWNSNFQIVDVVADSYSFTAQGVGQQLHVVAFNDGWRLLWSPLAILKKPFQLIIGFYISTDWDAVTHSLFILTVAVRLGKASLEQVDLLVGFKDGVFDGGGSGRSVKHFLMLLFYPISLS
jgi:hypothetical protein